MIPKKNFTGSRSARRRRDKSSLFSMKHFPYQAGNSCRCFKATIIPAQQSFKLRLTGQVHLGTTLVESSFQLNPVKLTICTRVTFSFMWGSAPAGTCSWMMTTFSFSCLTSVHWCIRPTWCNGVRNWRHAVYTHLNNPSLVGRLLVLFGIWRFIVHELVRIDEFL